MFCLLIELGLPPSKLSPTALENIETMKKEFEKKRKILVQNVSVGDPDSNNKVIDRVPLFVLYSGFTKDVPVSSFTWLFDFNS